MSSGAVQGDAWYTRREGVERGPYTAAQMSRYILLGRVREGDELRPEDGEWGGLERWPQLIPEVMKLPDTEENRRKLRLARMRADERRPGDRRERQPWSLQHADRRSGRERRRPETAEEIRYRELRYGRPPSFPRSRLYPLLVGGLALLALGALFQRVW
ncbi:MAG TPA: hypothetical protein ENK05_10750 [Gammaproteobacteria bacterium]|nr:hypothetical protein [Gammaproteobacteria bacterium]